MFSLILYSRLTLMNVTKGNSNSHCLVPSGTDLDRQTVQLVLHWLHRPRHTESRLVPFAPLLTDDHAARLALVEEDLLDVLLLLLVHHLLRSHVPIQQVS